MLQDGQPVGTCFRVTGLMPKCSTIITARHCIAEGGKCISGLTAFDHPLEFAMSCPRLDVAFFKGPAGAGFTMVNHVVSPGLPVELVAYPLVVDKEVRPASSCRSSGQISVISSSGQLGGADYGACKFFWFPPSLLIALELNSVGWHWAQVMCPCPVLFTLCPYGSHSSACMQHTFVRRGAQVCAPLPLACRLPK